MSLQELKDKIDEIETELKSKGLTLDMVLIQDTYIDDEKEIDLDLIEHYGYFFSRIEIK